MSGFPFYFSHAHARVHMGITQFTVLPMDYSTIAIPLITGGKISYNAPAKTVKKRAAS